MLLGNSFERLESRRLFAINPSGLEQEMLELINRMRTNPQAELNLLTKSKDADVNNALAFFKVNMSVLGDQWSQLDAVEPLAWNSALYNSARLHSNQMFNRDMQSHQLPGEPDLVGRITGSGYTNYTTAGENVFAAMKSPFYGHAAFAIDWANVKNGIQDPPGHRENIMNKDFREIGISIVVGSKTNVGPQLVTQDFGNRSNIGNSYFLGVVYTDKNGDGYYENGEGVKDATVTLKNGSKTYTTKTMSAGGYQIQVPAGKYSVTASGDVLGGTIKLNDVTVGSKNVKRDFTFDQVDYITVDDGVASIKGTTGNDKLALTMENGKIIAHRNGVRQTVGKASSFKAINISLGDGNDKLTVGAGVPGIFCESGLGNDSLTGGDGKDTLTGGGGKDTLYGGPGDDRLNGLTSGDLLFGAEGNDRLYGGGGNDVMDGGGGVDRLFGGDDNDSLIGAGSNDKLYGESGNDTLNGGKGGDLLNGGNGTDSAFVDVLDSKSHIEKVLT